MCSLTSWPLVLDIHWDPCLRMCVRRDYSPDCRSCRWSKTSISDPEVRGGKYFSDFDFNDSSPIMDIVWENDVLFPWSLSSACHQQQVKCRSPSTETIATFHKISIDLLYKNSFDYNWIQRSQHENTLELSSSNRFFFLSFLRRHEKQFIKFKSMNTAEDVFIRAVHRIWHTTYWAVLSPLKGTRAPPCG